MMPLKHMEVEETGTKSKLLAGIAAIRLSTWSFPEVVATQIDGKPGGLCGLSDPKSYQGP